MQTKRELLKQTLAAAAAMYMAGSRAALAQTIGGTDQGVLPADDYDNLLLSEADASWNDPDTKGVAVEAFACTPSPLLSVLGSNERNWPAILNTPLGPKWAALEDSAEYAHLTAYKTSLEDTFDLTAAALSRLAAQNSFRLGQGKVVLFGLRGCMLVNGDSTGPAMSVKLRATLPDHINFRCVVGSWDTETGLISAHAASTVPHVAHMLVQMHCVPKNGCNLLSTGLYTYQVGLHAKGSKSQKDRQVGAFLLQGAHFEPINGSPASNEARVCVLRTLDDFTFSPRSASEIWDFPNAELLADDIHSAVFDYDNYSHIPGKKAQYSDRFSSAGCQVVKGAYDLTPISRAFNALPVGPWADLRKCAGLAHPPVLLHPEVASNFVDVPIEKLTTKDDGKVFHYMLLTGLEALLASNLTSGFTEKIKLVRYGSSGDAVKTVQTTIRSAQLSDSYSRKSDFADKKLALIDGRCGYRTVWPILYHQHHRDGIMETGIMRAL